MEEQVHEPDAEPGAENGVSGVGALRAPTELARADDHVGFPGQDGGEHVHELPGIVAVVAIEKGDDVGPSGGGDAGEARLAVPAARLGDDTRALRPGDFGRAVARTVVHHDDLGHEPGDLRQHVADGGLFVDGGNDDGHGESGRETHGLRVYC